MNKFGKTLTIFLVIISVLLLTLTAITIFFYQNENEIRLDVEQKLSQTKAVEVKLQDEMKELKKQTFLQQEKLKESDEKINNLMDDVELEQGLREEIKNENKTLRDALSKESQEKKALKEQMDKALEELQSLAGKCTPSVPEAVEPEPAAVEEPAVEPAPVPALPADIQGRILSINEENNFIVFNLGKDDGLQKDVKMSVYRGDQYLGDVLVTRIQSKMSVADLVAPLSSKDVRIDDRVQVKE